MKMNRFVATIVWGFVIWLLLLMSVTAFCATAHAEPGHAHSHQQSSHLSLCFFACQAGFGSLAALIVFVSARSIHMTRFLAPPLSASFSDIDTLVFRQGRAPPA
ncbi:MAG: hypothetical protein MRJ96_10220 [Nitrospirales bacterium]|nr:hypothetical protein [Nitrospirales bacterium]